MRATSNEIIGSLVYRTSEALNRNREFMADIKKYRFYPALVNNGKFHLWHFPGTSEEISGVFKTLSGNTMHGSKLKFPAILNFQGVFEEHGFSEGVTLKRYNLAIVSPVLSEWTTQQREAEAYKLVLRPIEEEFIRQIASCGYFQTPVGKYPYMGVYIPTTGKALNSIMKIQYGDFMDAVELPNFSLKVLDGICTAKSGMIIEESKKVTDEIKNIIK